MIWYDTWPMQLAGLEHVSYAGPVMPMIACAMKGTRTRSEPSTPVITKDTELNAIAWESNKPSIAVPCPCDTPPIQMPMIDASRARQTLRIQGQPRVAPKSPETTA
mmetsp:Transcript_9359/g.23609  ORF Transcript_9359/g.23609 Transcript_9359/m.23609 type:complete len:106 (-) Transcript_9359:1404-1721(-)